MKTSERQAARILRSERGLSINEIATQLGVSKSSVSLWVRDVPLGETQIARLIARNPLYNRQLHSGRQRREVGRTRRAEYQEIGRRRAKGCDALHTAGCMLYWAEGSKSRNCLYFTNSDPDMVVFFLRFLRVCYGVQDDDVSVAVNCFDDCSSASQIEDFWLQKLRLPRTRLRKTTLNVHSNYSQKKRIGKLVYGTCRLTVSRTEIVQSIYGAIQEYAGFTNTTWIG